MNGLRLEAHAKIAQRAGREPDPEHIGEAERLSEQLGIRSLG